MNESVSRKRVTHVQDFSQLADSTAYFRRADVTSLSIKYKDAEKIEDFQHPVVSMPPEETFLSDMSGEVILSSIKNPSALDPLSREEKTLASLLAYVLVNEEVVRGTEESRTDSFVDGLLRMLDFDKYPLMMQLQPLYRLLIYGKDISSKFDFGISKDKRVVLIDEDKHIRNIGPSVAWGEYQIAGEMLVASGDNYQKTGQAGHTVFAIRVIGTGFTFYKTNASEEYLYSLGQGSPEGSMIILRYPPWSSANTEATQRNPIYPFPNLDFSVPSERRQVISILLSIRDYLLSS